MNRSALLARSAFLGLFTALVVGCAAGHDGDEAVSGDESQLRSLLPSEIAGSIAYGETKTIAYSAEPRYRALSFDATSGDEIEARFVGAKGLDTVGFVLSDSFATLAQNDDESATSRASDVKYKIPKDGKYYLAVREANEEDGNITISLSKTGVAAPPIPPPPPAPPQDAFDPQSCTGSAMTEARVIKYFPKGAASGSQTLSKADGRVYLRGRVCSEFSGCSDWLTKEVTTPTNDSGLEHLNGYDTFTGLVKASSVVASLADRPDHPVDVSFNVGAGNFYGWVTDYARFNSFTKDGSATIGNTYNNSSYKILYANLPLPVAERFLNVVPLDTVAWDFTLNETCAKAHFATTKVSAGKQQHVEMEGVIYWDVAAPQN
jgi:hypothetical protein